MVGHPMAHDRVVRVAGGEQDLDVTVEPKYWTGTAPAQVKVDIEKVLLLPSAKFVVGVGKTEPFKVTLTAPHGIEGDIVAMLFLCYKEDKASDLNIRNGIPLYLIIKGSQQYNARIESVDAEYTLDPLRKGNYLLSISHPAAQFSKKKRSVSVGNRDVSRVNFSAK